MKRRDRGIKHPAAHGATPACRAPTFEPYQFAGRMWHTTLTGLGCAVLYTGSVRYRTFGLLLSEERAVFGEWPDWAIHEHIRERYILVEQFSGEGCST